MALPQQKFREIVFLLLYSHDMGKASDEETLKLIMKELEVTKKSVTSAQERMFLILEKQDELDKMITSVSTSYEFERIQSVERNVLRLGVFELFFDTEVPPKVAIAEAMRLTRKFSTPESSNFVNALLDTLYKKSIGENVNLVNITLTADSLIKSEEFSHEAALTKLIPVEEEE